MSYNISYGSCGINYTSNVSKIWDEAMPDFNLRDMDGYTGKQVKETLIQGVGYIANNWRELEQQYTDESFNNWGSLQGAFNVLVSLLIEVLKDEKFTVVVNT